MRGKSSFLPPHERSKLFYTLLACDSVRIFTVFVAAVVDFKVFTEGEIKIPNFFVGETWKRFGVGFGRSGVRVIRTHATPPVAVVVPNAVAVSPGVAVVGISDSFSVWSVRTTCTTPSRRVTDTIP